MNKNNYKKTLSFLLVLIIVFSPIFKVSEVWGQLSTGSGGSQLPSSGLGGPAVTTSITPGGGPAVTTSITPGGGPAVTTSITPPGAVPQSSQTESDPSKNGILPTTSNPPRSTEGGVQMVATDVSSCITSVMAAGLTKLAGEVLGKATGGIVSLQEVPVNPTALTNVEVGYSILGVPILPGVNSIAYCLVNATIAGIADSTIVWIQSGFEGKPAFVDDPTKLFQDIAEYELSGFLENLGGGFLCEQFEPYVKLGLVNSYTEGYSTQGRCTLDQVQGNIDSFLSGDSFDYDTWFSMTQNPANNPYGSYLMAKDQAQNEIEAGIGPLKLELEWGNGFLPWKGAKGTVNEGKTITTGQMIEAQLQEHLGIVPERLVLAEKFDQVVSELVNQLIKTALNETFEAIQ